LFGENALKGHLQLINYFWRHPSDGSLNDMIMLLSVIFLHAPKSLILSIQLELIKILLKEAFLIKGISY